MNDKAIILLVIAMITVVMLSSILIFLLFRRLSRTSVTPLSQDMTGVTVARVRRLQRTFGFFGRTGNGISPRLEVTPEGLRFKVFKPDYWPFSEITEVDAAKILFMTRVSIKHRSGDRLYADLADKAAGREMLRALPRQISLTTRASNMRDDVS